jgi:hypothetical protein
VSPVEQHLKQDQQKKKLKLILVVTATHSTPANKDTSKPTVELIDSTVNTDLNKKLTGLSGFF